MTKEMTRPVEMTRPLEWAPPKLAISRLPYLPGLDGMRALAVVAVMIYHANNSWLPGGFLGVEVFFVISGYLITLLLIGEHERSGRIDLPQFWLRRARRLLPALFVLLIGLAIYTTLFRRDALGQLRGDVIAGLTYITNWYQIWVGQGYTAAGDFAPLRHLWSLAVEEQFYLLWPLAMVGLMHLGRRRLPELSRWLFLGAIAITVLLALLFRSREIAACDVTPNAYWNVGGRCISKVDALYLNTISRVGGLMLGAAFAMIWRPVALMRGPMRDKGGILDGVAIVGLGGLAALFWYLHLVTPEGGDPLLFRGGLLWTGLATLAVIAAVTHRGSQAGPILGNAVLLWIGTRSYGLYLFHWPVYQAIRRIAGVGLTVPQFLLAMAITVPIAEVSYRMVETPIRKGHVGRWWRRLQARRDPTPRRMIAGAGAAVVALSVFAAANLATAELKQNEIAESLAEGAEANRSLDELLGPGSTTPSSAVEVTETSTAAEPEETSPPASEPPPETASADTAPAIPPPSVVPVTTTAAAPPPVAAAAPPPPTVDPNAKPPVALGDSVMQGALEELAAGGMFVNAQQNRQLGASTAAEVQTIASGDGFGDIVVVHLGTNGYIENDDVNEFFTALSGVQRVVVMTIRADREWTAGNNTILFDVPNRFANVELLDWNGLSNSCPGDCFFDDGIHINQAGQDYYASLIFQTIGI